MDNNRIPLHLNQNNLQDFLDCPRRFQLRVLDEKSWPAASTSSLTAVETSIFLGNRFHQICQQYFTGVPTSHIERSISDDKLLDMWKSFLVYVGIFQSRKIFSEQLLQIPFNNQRLIAKFDLLIELDDQYLIVDWKTSSTKPPLPLLTDRVQTYLYPYIFAIAGGELFSKQVIYPGSVKFIYWYPLCSEPEISFQYSQEQHVAVEQKLHELVAKIDRYMVSDPVFPLTEDLSKCQFCPYRSLCERGSRPGDFDLLVDLEDFDWSEIKFVIEQISELEF
jgi:hypothetical protein